MSRIADWARFAARARHAAAFGIVLVAANACSSQPVTDGVTAVQFKDVVVPDGLRLKTDGNASYSREEASWRHGRFEYVGQADVQAAANYVRERMPQHSWTKVRDEVAAETGVRMRFERGIYATDYSISRSEGTTVMVVDYSTDYARR